jgi:hypothetical protein
LITRNKRVTIGNLLTEALLRSPLLGSDPAIDSGPPGARYPSGAILAVPVILDGNRPAHTGPEPHGSGSHLAAQPLTTAPRRSIDAVTARWTRVMKSMATSMATAANGGPDRSGCRDSCANVAMTRAASASRRQTQHQVSWVASHGRCKSRTDVGSSRRRPSHEEGAHVRVEEDIAVRAAVCTDR